ncbi:MAG: MBOAT family protein [Bacteroidaceae bacterium]|nr:MBOAT family protein [Bacteroidaceae bacterium]
MLFNSFEFLVFFPLVCIVYFLLKDNRWRIPFLLIASYYFYMNWKPVYAVLIMTSTMLTYLCGLLVEKHAGNKPKQKAFLVTSLVINFAILFVFKYFNFINESVFTLLEMSGLRWNVPNLNILLPVGISFYTFQAVGYSIDVYRGTIKAERNFMTYALFVSFFPQLVAGPIERAKNLLPQFREREHRFNYNEAIDGLKQMLWGFFMKLCVADVIGEYVTAVYDHVGRHTGTSLVLATLFFVFQVYCDFAGYSNIAIGAARVMGFRLMENFRRPFFSPNMREFWKRWHISLSSWFMDYVYIPLGGSRVKYARYQLNLMTTFLLSGLWHGANWTYVCWGGLHGIFLVVGNLWRKYVHEPQYKTTISRLTGTVVTFCLFCFAVLFFRANDVADAITIIGKIITDCGPLFVDNSVFVYGLTALAILIFKDAKDEFNWKVNFMHSKHIVVRYISTIALIAYIILFGSFSGGQFIYFQF